MNKTMDKKSHLKTGNKIMLLNFKEFQSHFSEKLSSQDSQIDHLFSQAAFFNRGVKDAINLLSEMYSSGRLDLTYRNRDGVGVNNISEYEYECQLNAEVDMDEFEHPLLSRYYYSGVKQIFECMNRDFKVELRR